MATLDANHRISGRQEFCLPSPDADWINRSELATILGISPRTAQTLAKEGKLTQFEHGIGAGGRRRYSRFLVEREFRQRLGEAIRRQDEGLSNTELTRDGEWCDDGAAMPDLPQPASDTGISRVPPEPETARVFTESIPSRTS